MQAKVTSLYKRHFGAATWDILRDYIRSSRRERIFCFHGWNGFGVAPVLGFALERLLITKDEKTPPELCFDRIIHIDCSAWKSTREVQRKIVEALKLEYETMAMFDEQDEEDDFSGVDQGSRDVIQSVAQVINQTLIGTKSIILFLNGSDSEIDLSRTGVPLEEYRNNMMLWIFKGRFLTMHCARDEIAGKLRYTNYFICGGYDAYQFDLYELCELFQKEAAGIIDRNPCLQNTNLTRVSDCCLYDLFLHCSFHKATAFDWVAHSSNYWMCDGIIEEDITREVSIALNEEVRWLGYDSSLLEAVSKKLMKSSDTPFLVLNDDTVESSIVDKARTYRWISIISKNLKIQEGMIQAILESASSLFIAFERSDDPQGLPGVFFKQSNTLSVLILSWCAFNFASPPFLHCHRLRFLGLDRCKNDNTTSGGGNCTNWACLHNLWVLDIRHTEWNEILTEEKMDIMVSLRELNIEGFYCWQYANKLQGRLPNLERLRIIKPTRQAETSLDCNNSFVGKTKLQLLDLSGNRDMKSIPTSIAMASGLQVLILDGCDGLENVHVPGGLPSTLRSFSLDGYGPAAHWSPFPTPESLKPERQSDTDKNNGASAIPMTSKISLQGCTLLENLFVRWLPNLEELDLSETAIKILSFETMLLNVPALKRLILLGCEHLRAIAWGTASSGSFHSTKLNLLCVDTRPAGAWRTSAVFTRPLSQKSFQLHAILVDPRLTGRSLFDPVSYYGSSCFNIHITCSTEPGGDNKAASRQEMFGHPCGRGDQRHHALAAAAAASQYGDDDLLLLTESGDVPMMAFPQPPSLRLDRHIEISGGSHSLESVLMTRSAPGKINLLDWMRGQAQSLHVHDVSTSKSWAAIYWDCLRWCRVERCPNWDAVFPPDSRNYNNCLETIWASDLKMARCIWSKGTDFKRAPYFYSDRHLRPASFAYLQHLHLRSCPMLQFALPVSAAFPSLITLHVIRCDRLRHIFAMEGWYPEELGTHGVPFQKLATIHLYELPVLQQICEAQMLAPALETVRVRGCFALRRLPAVKAREPGAKRPAVEVEKDVWDALEWDGMAADHHPQLYEAPVHSRYYRARHLRGTVLR